MSVQWQHGQFESIITGPVDTLYTCEIITLHLILFACFGKSSLCPLPSPTPVLSPCSAQPPVHTVLYVAILETCNFAMPSSCLIESLSAPEWLSWYQWHKRGVWQRFFVSFLATEQTTLKWSQLSFQHFIEILE